jgi:filamentous hemagglutinin family protein
MNRAYRVVFNSALGSWVAVAETVRSAGKKGGLKKLSASVALALVAGVPQAYALDGSALPSAGVISAGRGSISSTGANMTVNQLTQSLAINWQSFNVGSNASVNFVQPSSSAIALNRVIGSDPSAIYGRLNANGQVFLLNPNGVLFGPTAQVSVGGLVASTLDLSDSDFLARRMRLSGGQAAVINQGSITASDGGYVALLGAQVSNQGSITARLGKVALASGTEMVLDFVGDGLIGVSVTKGAIDALAENKQLIAADGGEVLLTAKAADQLVRAVVNNEGVIEARTVDNRAGTIRLMGDMASGVVRLSGTLDASAPTSGNGGFVETSAAQVKIADTARVSTAAPGGKTGQWLIDPTDFTIAASGGDMSGSAVAAALASNNLTIQSDSGVGGTTGDINVNDTFAWGAHTLTLHAQNNINFNLPIQATGTAGLALEYGQANPNAGNSSTYNVNQPVDIASTGSFSTKLGSDGPTITYTIINSLGAQGSTTGTDLQGISGNLAGNFVVGSNIDATPTASWNSGAGFTPLGDSNSWFGGTFDGLGHTITSLSINRPSTDFVGLFGLTAMAYLSNFQLNGASVSGANYVGALVGRSNGGRILNVATNASSVTGTDSYIGGLVGQAIGGDITQGFTSGTVTDTFGTPSGSGTPGFGGNNVGGLAGSTGVVTVSKSASSATVNAAGGNNVGGLIGGALDSQISFSMASSSVHGYGNTGGLVGRLAGTGQITDSYSLGTVFGTDTGAVGGLVGLNDFASIARTYSLASVSGSGDVGGLVGFNDGLVENSYSMGNVSGTNAYTLGGLVGANNNGSIYNTFSRSTVSGTAFNIGGFCGSCSTLSLSGNFWDRGGVVARMPV